jgi:hypothetical protein
VNRRSYAAAEALSAAIAVPAADLRVLRSLLGVLEGWLCLHAGTDVRAGLEDYLTLHHYGEPALDAAALTAELADTCLYLTDLLVNGDTV